MLKYSHRIRFYSRDMIMRTKPKYHGMMFSFFFAKLTSFINNKNIDTANDWKIYE